MHLKHTRAAFVLVPYLAASAVAGPMEDAADAYARGDYTKALRLIRPLANDGEAEARFNLGLMYVTGRGVPQDYAAAVIWFRKAADQGDAIAKGMGVPQNYAEAMIWFRKAAEQGHRVAKLYLGSCTLKGEA
jgi:TPR repeat protein